MFCCHFRGNVFLLFMIFFYFFKEKLLKRIILASNFFFSYASFCYLPVRHNAWHRTHNILYIFRLRRFFYVCVFLYTKKKLKIFLKSMWMESLILWICQNIWVVKDLFNFYSDIKLVWKNGKNTLKIKVKPMSFWYYGFYRVVTRTIK